MVTSLNPILRTALFCTIDGIPTSVYQAGGQSGVNRPIGTGSVTLRAPMPAHIDINVPIEIQGGYSDGVIRALFSGRVTDTVEEFTDNGALVTVNAESWAVLLDWKQETDLTFAGPISLYEICRSLCEWRGVPNYVIDQITAPDGTTVIMLGGNPDYEDGNIVIPRRTSPLQWLRSTLALFGYRIFDTLDGTIRVQRISGSPTGTIAETYETGVNLYNLRRTRDVRQMVTYITVEGPSYTDSDGIRVQPRSIPDEVPESQYLIPPGYRADDVSSSVLISIDLTDIARNVAEIDGGAPLVHERWETRGDSWRQPGEAVTVTSSHLETDGDYWVMDIDWRIDDGYESTMEGWAGGGEALLAGIDSIDIAVATGPFHLGDETISWYAVDSPSPGPITLPIMVPDTYTAMILTGKGHGCNSFFIGGVNTEDTVSKLEVWQAGESVGSADLPVMPENYEKRLDYTNITNWQSFRMPVSGRLEPGSAEVRIVAGVQSDASAGPRDDFEVRDLIITLTGVGTPTLPSGGA